MNKITTFLTGVGLLCSLASKGQDPWIIKADKIDPANYYGATVANGMIGVVSSPQPFQVKNVVLAGAYDLYGRGRVSNFLNSFNLLNMYIHINGHEIDPKKISNFHQQLDMKNAAFTTTFDYQDLASIKYTYYALRQLPFTVLMDVSVTAKKAIQITAASEMQAPDALKDVQNYYDEVHQPRAGHHSFANIYCQKPDREIDFERLKRFYI
jgi:trehalose/maltose hydrolase-like predicted phosphorylase